MSIITAPVITEKSMAERSNNVYTFNVNAALPELPEDPNNNVRITPILNKITY